MFSVIPAEAGIRYFMWLR